MDKFFLAIYNYLSARRGLMYFSFIAILALMIFSLTKLKLNEDISKFLPEEAAIAKTFNSDIFANKSILAFSLDSIEGKEDKLKEVAEDFYSSINKRQGFKDNAKLNISVDSSLIDLMGNFIYTNLPFLLEDSDYLIMEKFSDSNLVSKKMQSNFEYLSSPMGAFVEERIFKDPFSFSSNAFMYLNDMFKSFEYKIIDGYIFAKDKASLIAYIDINKGAELADRNMIVEIIEDELSILKKKHLGLSTYYFSADAVAFYNAKIIKGDSNFSLIVLCVFVLGVFFYIFKTFRAIVYIFAPVVFGALFALSIIYLIKGDISLIAIGASSITLGIALSYSIHFTICTIYSKDAKELICELAKPLSIGAFTTICAFLGLLFTSSPLLQDFGLFSSLSLIGASLFILIYLVHFSKYKTYVSFNLGKFHISKSFQKYISLSIIFISIICAIFFSRIEFNGDIFALSYMPSHLEKSEKYLNTLADKTEESSQITFVVSETDMDLAVNSYLKLKEKLDTLIGDGKVYSYSLIDKFLKTKKDQSLSLLKWNDFWTSKRKGNIFESLKEEIEKFGFEDDSFDGFKDIINKDYQGIDYSNEIFSDWIFSDEVSINIVAQVKLKNEFKEEIYAYLCNENGVYAIDKSFFASKVIANVYKDFNFILFYCASLVFLALLFCYGRFELTMLAFLPMLISWVIIIGLMDLFNIEFNIVTVLLSVFIFGVGDDFSVFILDGLLNKYKTKSDIISRHKVAIFLSALSIIVGIGILIFAEHPTMYSLGLISLIGMLVVLVVAFTLQQFLFNIFIQNQGENGNLPITFLSLLKSMLCFFVFLMGCFFISLTLLALQVIPLKTASKKRFLHCVVNKFAYYFLKFAIGIDFRILNENKEDFKKPSVIIANHQSLIDILMILALNEKFVVLVKNWVWKSPFFGLIVKYLDYYNVDEGYENIAEKLKEKIALGYSIVVFPEGTRSSDLEIKRFRKGAFYLAEMLNLDIVPVVIYGSGLVCSKNQPFYIKRGLIIAKILGRISPSSKEFSGDLRLRTKEVLQYFRLEYQNLYEEYNRTQNPYFKYAIIKNYTYKSSFLECYYRLTLPLAGYYEAYDNTLPREGDIVDFNCDYAAMPYMMTMLSKKRKITAIDADADKIKLAENCPLKNDNINFINADIKNIEIYPADAYILSLYYLNFDILKGCIRTMKTNSIILIKESDFAFREDSLYSFVFEKLFRKFLKSKKTSLDSNFLTKEKLAEICVEYSLDLEEYKKEKFTIIKKKV